MQAPRVEHKNIESFDGTRIGYQVCGEGPAVVLANGLGGTYTVWRHQYALFGQSYRVISWDYRGLFRSGRPPALDSVAVDRQVADLEAVLAAEGVDRALFLGWSMGVQFTFEYYRRHPEQFVGIVALNGVAGVPFETALRTPLVGYALPGLAKLMKVTAPALGPLTRVAGKTNALLPLFKVTGLAARSLDPDVFVDLIGEYSTLDFEAYGETLRHLGQHDAREVLPGVGVPTLVVTGTCDLFTPLETSREMVRVIPDARLVVVKGGTHYTAVEFPDQVNAALRQFVGELGYGALSSHSSR